MRDAAFEATFREGPTGGMGVWTDPSKVPTNYTEWAYALTTREGCLGRFRMHLPQGASYTDDEICEAFPICLQRRCIVQMTSTNKLTWAWQNGEGIVDNMFFLCENALASTNNIPIMEMIGASASETNSILYRSTYRSYAFESILVALGMTDEKTCYLCSIYTNSAHWARHSGTGPIDMYIRVYTNGCDSATSSVVENAAATFNPLTWQARYWIPTVDTLAAVAVGIRVEQARACGHDVLRASVPSRGKGAARCPYGKRLHRSELHGDAAMVARGKFGDSNCQALDFTAYRGACPQSPHR